MDVPETVHHHTVRCSARGAVLRDTDWDKVTCDDCHEKRRSNRQTTKFFALGCLGVFVLLFVGCIVIVLSTGNDSTPPRPTTSPRSTTPRPAAQTAPPIRATVPLSSSTESEADTLLGYYHKLMDFKDNPDFHLYCYGVGGPYNTWATNVQALDGGISILTETGIVPGDLWQMGREYCKSGGRETEHTIYMKSQMKPSWLSPSP